MTKVDEITQIIGRKFLSFGGGRGSQFNPMAEALKDEELQFATGVDIKSVVQEILKEAGIDNLLKACRKAKKTIQAMGSDDETNKVVKQIDKAIAKAKQVEE